MTLGELRHLLRRAGDGMDGRVTVTVQIEGVEREVVGVADHGYMGVVIEVAG